MMEWGVEDVTEIKKKWLSKRSEKCEREAADEDLK